MTTAWATLAEAAAQATAIPGIPAMATSDQAARTAGRRPRLHATLGIPVNGGDTGCSGPGAPNGGGNYGNESATSLLWRASARHGIPRRMANRTKAIPGCTRQAETRRTRSTPS